jgi:hypothetical protein
VLRPQIVIGGVPKKVCDGRPVDETTLRFALAASMPSSRRSGLRALFERRHEMTTAMPMCVSPIGTYCCKLLNVGAQAIQRRLEEDPK